MVGAGLRSPAQVAAHRRRRGSRRSRTEQGLTPIPFELLPAELVGREAYQGFCWDAFCSSRAGPSPHSRLDSCRKIALTASEPPMKDETEIWWGMYVEHATQGRHHEQQRTAVTSFFAALAAGVVGVITHDKCINLSDLPLALFLVITGVFGAFFSAKQYERYNLHMQRARVYRNALAGHVPNARLLELKDEADRVSKSRFPLLSRSPLAVLWIALHLLIAVFGAVLAIGAYYKIFACVAAS